MWGEREIECVRQRVSRKRDIVCETESEEKEGYSVGDREWGERVRV